MREEYPEYPNNGSEPPAHAAVSHRGRQTRHCNPLKERDIHWPVPPL